MKKPDGFGICTWCQEEYDCDLSNGKAYPEDKPKPENLFKIRGELVCSCCAQDYHADKEFVESAYGVDEQ